MTRARQMRGFTLTELMVVATVIGILAAVAFPAYRDATLRARRTVAKVALTKVAGLEESWFTDRKTYSASLGATDGLGLVPGSAVTSYYVDANGNAGATASAALYSITLGNISSAGGIVTSWTLTATPQNAQRRDTTCGDLILKQDGTKSASSLRSDCWSR